MSTITVVLGNRRSPRASHSSANATRKRIVRTSEMLTSTPKPQCTFSHVTQKSVARNRKPVSFMPLLRFARPGSAAQTDERAKPARPGDGVAGAASRHEPQEEI